MFRFANYSKHVANLFCPHVQSVHMNVHLFMRKIIKEKRLSHLLLHSYHMFVFPIRPIFTQFGPYSLLGCIFIKINSFVSLIKIYLQQRLFLLTWKYIAPNTFHFHVCRQWLDRWIYRFFIKCNKQHYYECKHLLRTKKNTFHSIRCWKIELWIAFGNGIL